MGVIISDLGDKQPPLKLAWWAWRPILGLILASNSLTDTDGVRLSAIAVTDLLEASAAEAKSIAEYLENRVLAQMKPNERLLQDGTLSSKPDDGHFYRDPEEAVKNYSVDYDTLTTFMQFCKKCDGFTVD
jgi:hypothetical protein